MVVTSYCSPDKQVKYVYFWWYSAMPTRQPGRLYTDGGYQQLFIRQPGRVCILIVVISYCSPDNQVKFVYCWWISATAHQTSRSSLYTREVFSYCLPDKQVKFVYSWGLSAAVYQTTRSSLYKDGSYHLLFTLQPGQVCIITVHRLYTDGGYQLHFTSQAGQVCVLMVVISNCSPDNQVKFVYRWWLSGTLQ